jgi:hypothetical protein
MTLREAQDIIRSDTAGMVKWALAAGEIISSQASSLEDLLACLKRGSQPASVAATALYVRTKRPRRDNSLASFSADYQDWFDYLREKGLI